jgi:hypothetical protein
MWLASDWMPSTLNEGNPHGMGVCSVGEAEEAGGVRGE